MSTTTHVASLTGELTAGNTVAGRTVSSHTPAGSGASLPDWLRLITATTARGLLFTLLGMMFWAAAPAVVGWVPTTVMSDSMAPLIRAGDVVIAQPSAPSTLRPGQVLLTEDPDHVGRLRLHRFVDVTADGLLITKGDANPAADSTAIAASAVRGVGYMRIPFVGLPVVWIYETRFGLVAAATVGLLLLMYVTGTDRSLRRRHLSMTRRHAASTVCSHPRIAAVMASTTLVPAALVLCLAASVVASGGAGAVFSRTTVTPTNTLATSTYNCLDRTPANNPYLYLAFNEASGTTATDSSGNGHTGTLTSGATREVGSCATNASPVLNLNGTSGQVTTSTLVNAPTIFTVATWFRTSTTTGGKLIGFGNSQSGLSSQYDRQIYMTNAGRIVFGIYNNNYYSVTSTNSYNDGQGHYVAATLSSAGMNLYIDGARVGTSTATTTAEPHTGYWRIGYDSISGWPSAPASNYFRGELDDTAVYLSALTASQVAAEYGKGP